MTAKQRCKTAGSMWLPRSMAGHGLNVRIVSRGPKMGEKGEPYRRHRPPRRYRALQS